MEIWNHREHLALCISMDKVYVETLKLLWSIWEKQHSLETSMLKAILWNITILENFTQKLLH